MKKTLYLIANDTTEEVAIANARGGEAVFELAQDNSLFVPYGRYQHEKGMQIFDREAAEELQRGFNSVLGKLGRMFNGGVPVFAGHPDVPGRPDSNPAAPAYGWLQGVEVEADGARFPVKWGRRGQDAIENGDFRFYSPLWWLKRVKGGLRPVRLISFGLTNHPRIPVPAIANDETKNHEEKQMTEEQLKAIGLEPGATDEQIKTRLDELATAANDVQTEKARADKAVADLQTANDTLAGKDNEIQAANDAAKKHREARIDAALDGLVAGGRLKQADRDPTRQELVALENDEDLSAKLTELAEADAVVKTKPTAGAGLAAGKRELAADNDATARAEKRQEAVDAELARIANDTPADARYELAWSRAQRKHPELFSAQKES